MSKHSVPTQADRAYIVALLLETPFGPKWRAAQDLAVDVFENTRFEGYSPCDKCRTSGFVTVTTGEGPHTEEDFTCFRCKGKGWQSPADVRRNKAYAKYQGQRRQTTLGL